MKLPMVWAAALSLLLLNSCAVIRYNVPKITDYQIFNTDTVSKSEQAFAFARVENDAQLPDEFLWSVSKKKDTYYEYESPEAFLEATGTHSLIVIRNDTILYEKYFNGYQADNIQTVFSVTKSFAATLTFMALKDGSIKSLDQPVSDFIPDFNQKGKEKITIRHLLQMTSGIAEKDYRNPGKLLTMYYAKDHEKKCRKIGMKQEPGTNFAYSSMTTQILGMCVERATGKKFAEYLGEKIWAPLGMEHDALVSLDKTGSAKQYGGISATPIDIAKLGKLYLHNGIWNGEHLLPEDYALINRTRDTTNGASPTYAYSFWLDTYPTENVFDKNDFFAGGYRGQVVYVNPDNNTVIVRTGKKESSVHWGRTLSKLAQFPIIPEEGIISQENLASLAGCYKNSFGKTINLLCSEDGKIFMKDDDDDDDDLEMEPQSEVTFLNKKKGYRMLVQMRKNQIKGIILESGKESFSFSKL